MRPVPGQVRRILAIAPNWLGDIVMCTPALRALKQRYPEAELTVLTRAAGCAVLKGLPWLDRCLAYPANRGLSHWFALRSMVRERRPDVVVVFPHSERGGLTAFLAGAPCRLGYRRGFRGPLLNMLASPHRVNGRITPIYMATEYLQLVERLGCEDDGRGLELHAAEEDRRHAKGMMAEAGPWVAMAPGAAFGPSKRWPAERYAAVADALYTARGIRTILLTGPGEEDTRDAVLNAAASPVVDTYARAPEIGLLKGILAEADLFIGNDSGPRHMAVAFGKPVICVMGSTSPLYTESPWERGRVIRVDVDCGPCQKPECTTDHRCMTRITPEMVTDAALAHLP